MHVPSSVKLQCGYYKHGQQIKKLAFVAKTQTMHTEPTFFYQSNCSLCLQLSTIPNHHFEKQACEAKSLPPFPSKILLIWLYMYNWCMMSWRLGKTIIQRTMSRWTTQVNSSTLGFFSGRQYSFPLSWPKFKVHSFASRLNFSQKSGGGHLFRCKEALSGRWWVKSWRKRVPDKQTIIAGVRTSTLIPTVHPTLIGGKLRTDLVNCNHKES